MTVDKFEREEKTMGMPTVLLYNLDSEKGRKIKLLCLVQKLRVRSVAPEECGLTLLELLEGKEPAGEPAEVFSEEMLLMVDLSDRQRNDFLSAFRRKKIPAVALKAVLTATNREWSSKKLRDELSLEHEAMLHGKSAHE